MSQHVVVVEPKTPLSGLDIGQQAMLLASILKGSTEYSIVAKDLDGTIIAWNEGARRIYGYDPDDVVGKVNAFVLHAPEDVKSGRARAILDETLKTGKWEGSLARVRKNGTRFTAHVTMTLRRDDAGAPIGFTMISRDLTDSEKAESALREQQAYNRGLIESSIDALMTTDTIGLITDVNRQMCEVTGYSREELIGTPFKKYFTDAKRAEDGIRRVLAEDRVTNYELTLRAKGGRETVVSYNATTFRAADGKLRGVFAAARDITDQKGLEAQLREQQTYTRGLIEASVDALVTVDPQNRIMDVNDQMARLSGYSRDELIGSAFTDYFTDPDRAGEGVKQTLGEGYVTDYVLTLRAKGGTETLVSFNASVFRDTDGTTRGIFAAARDITAQKQLEDQLRQAQNYTRGLIESSVDPMITVDPTLTITDVNFQMERLTGVEKAKLVGSRFDKYFTEPERAASGVRKTLGEGYVTNYELTLRAAEGKEVLVSFNASVFRDTEKNVKGIFAVARDVTEQRKLAQELTEQQNYSRGLIEASVDALVTVDPQGRITDVNDQMVKLTGHNRKQLVGSPFASYFTDPTRANEGVRQTFEQSVVTNYELQVRGKSGAEMLVSFNAAVFKDITGRVAGIFAAARDITAQKQLEAQLREQQNYSRSLIEASIDALMTIDTLGIITDVNKQMCEVTGFTTEELIGTPFKNYCTDPKRAEDGVRQVLSEGRVTNYELTIKAKNSKETVVSYNATTFKGTDGKLRGVYAAARDVTEQKRLEAKFSQAQKYNRGLIESSVDAMLTVAPDLTITDVNEQMVKLSGYSRDELVGSSFQDYFTEPDRAADGVRKTLDDAFVTNYELHLRSRHRRIILVSFNASVYKDADGRQLGIFAVARDVTEQRRLEEKLRESENYNRGLIESSVDALVTVSPDLTITDVNEQMIRMAGYTREELIGSLFKDYFTEPERAAAGVRETLAKGSVTNYELVLKSQSGKRTVVSFNAGTFTDVAGRVAGILAAAREITEQKRLELELREQQAYNRNLIESSVDALMTVDPSGVITDVNEQTVRMFGFNRKQLVGSPFPEYFTDSARAQEGVGLTFSQGVVTNYELVARTKSSRKIPVSFNAAVFKDISGRVAGILAAARDSTAQKGVEQELREQQTYNRNLIESSIDALMTTDALGIITDVNRQMCELTGIAKDDLLGTPFKSYCTDPTRAEDGIRQVLADGSVTNYELTIRNKEGAETTVSYNAATLRSADGKLRGVFAAARDITDQKHLEGRIVAQNRELTDTTTFLNNVLESSTEYSIIASDLSGEIQAWNEGARRNYGYSTDEMIGTRTLSSLHTPEDMQSGRVRALLETALKSGKAEGVFERVRKNGDRFTASLAVTLRRDADSKPVGYVIISKDITEQKILEAQLHRKNEELEEQNRRVQEANRLKSEFLANMSHELRTPLNAIIGFAELMHDERVGQVSGEQKEYLGDILTSSRHLLQLINDVLDLSKVESGKMQFKPEVIDLTKLIVEVRDILRSIAAGKRISIQVDVAPELSSITADPAKLKQVMYNYLSNALKFTPENGKVTVRARSEDGDRLRIEVQDTGIGIKPQDINKLFVEFQQLDSSTAKKYPGTGLGLALTKRIAEAQNGHVGVESIAGKGSTFFVVLPKHAEGRSAPRTVELPPSFPAINPSKKVLPIVLVIEDDPRERVWLTETLRRGGYDVREAGTGAEAMILAKKMKFAAITLDLLLPDTTGSEVLKEIRTSGLNLDTPVIVVTVLGDSDVVVGFKPHAVLNKPATSNVLLGALERARVSPETPRPILVVDDSASALKIAAGWLRRAGYSTVCCKDIKSALEAAKAEPPAAVLLDLKLENESGFDFLTAFRHMQGNAETPVILWTSADVDAVHDDALANRVRAVVPKGSGGPMLLEELQLALNPEVALVG